MCLLVIYICIMTSIRVHECSVLLIFSSIAGAMCNHRKDHQIGLFLLQISSRTHCMPMIYVDEVLCPTNAKTRCQWKLRRERTCNFIATDTCPLSRKVRAVSKRAQVSLAGQTKERVLTLITIRRLSAVFVRPRLSKL